MERDAMKLDKTRMSGMRDATIRVRCVELDEVWQGYN